MSWHLHNIWYNGNSIDMLNASWSHTKLKSNIPRQNIKGTSQMTKYQQY